MKHAATGWVLAVVLLTVVGTPAQAVLPPGAVLTVPIAEFDFPVTQLQARTAVSAGAHLVEEVYVPDESLFDPADPTKLAGFHIIDLLDANHGVDKTAPFKSISLAAHANGVIAVTFKSTGMTVFAKTAVTPAGGGKSDIAITGFSRHIIKTAVDGVADATTSLGAIAFKEIDGRTYLLGGSDGGGSEQTPGKIRVFVPDPIAPNVVYKVDVHDIVHGSFAGDGGFGSDLTAEFASGDPNTFVAPTTAVGVDEVFPGVFTKFEVSEGVTDGLAVFGDEIWLSDENNRRNIFVKKGGVIYTINIESLITAFDTNDNEPDPDPFDGAFADQKFHGVSGLLLSFDGEFIRLARPRQGKVNLGRVLRGNELKDFGFDINGDGVVEDAFVIGIVPTVGGKDDTIWTTADPSAERDEQDVAETGDILLVRDAGSATILGYDSHGFCVIPAPGAAVLALVGTGIVGRLNRRRRQAA